MATLLVPGCGFGQSEDAPSPMLWLSPSRHRLPGRTCAAPVTGLCRPTGIVICGVRRRAPLPSVRGGDRRRTVHARSAGVVTDSEFDPCSGTGLRFARRLGGAQLERYYA